MKIIKHTKNVLLATIITASFVINNNINSFILVRSINSYNELTQTGISYHMNLPKNLTNIFITAAATTCASYIAYMGAKTYITYQNAQEQCNILKEFETNPNYTYENLKTDASNLYYAQCPNASLKSVDSDYPVIWLAESATKNSKFLSKLFFLYNLTELGEKLGQKLAFLRNNADFKQNKLEYSIERRRVNYNYNYNLSS